MIAARQTDKRVTVRNDRLVAVPIAARDHADLRSVKALNRARLREIEEFFLTYNRQFGRTFVILGTYGPRQASAMARNAVRAGAG